MVIIHLIKLEFSNISIYFIGAWIPFITGYLLENREVEK